MQNKSRFHAVPVSISCGTNRNDMQTYFSACLSVSNFKAIRWRRKSSDNCNIREPDGCKHREAKLPKIVSLIVSYEDIFLKKKELFCIDEYEDLMKECIFAPDFAVSPVGPAVHYMIKGAYWRFSSACKLRNFTPERKNDNSNRLRVRSYSRMHAPWPLWAFGA